MNPETTPEILLFLARGFEDLEAVAVLSVFGWTQYRKRIPKARVITAGFHKTVNGRFGLNIRPEYLYSDIVPERYRALVLPGGFHDHGYGEAYDPRIHRLATEIHENGGHIATMCVGILPIAEAGLLKGRKATTYPYSRNHDNIARLKESGAIVTDAPVVEDDRIISCQGPGNAVEVALRLMESLLGPYAERQVRHYMNIPQFDFS